MWPFDVMAVRLFLRLFVGVMLLSVSVNKLAHPRQFQRAIEDYQIVPSTLASKNDFSMILAIGIPLAELLSGLGLLSGFWLIPAIVLAVALCSGCVVVSCNESGACKAHNPATPLEIEYKLRLGCTPPGCTFSSYYYECNSSCNCYY